MNSRWRFGATQSYSTEAKPLRSARIFRGGWIKELAPGGPEYGRRWIVPAVALYAVTVIAYFVLPAPADFSGSLIGSAVYNHDAVLNAGILEWGYRSLWSPGLRVFDWPAGFPLKNGLAGTENLLGWQLIYSPMRVIGLSVPASYSITLLSSLVISGTTCAALARRLGASIPGALTGGFIFAFNPFHLDHLIHVQTMAICWSPLAILGLDFCLEKRSLQGLIMLVIGIVMTVASGMYFGVFLAGVLPAYAALCWLTGRYRLSAQSVMCIGAGALLCVALLLPIILPYLEFGRDYGRYPHPGSELALSALSLRSLAQTPIWLSAWSSSILAAKGTGWFANAFPGIVTLVLASVGLVEAPAHRAKRNIVVILVVLAAVCLLLSFGPTLQIRPGQSLTLANSLPLPGKIWLYFSAIRWPMRIYMYSTLSLALVASLGASELLDKRRHVWRIPVSMLIMTLLFIELRPATWFVRRSLAIANPLKISDAYAFLAREEDRGGVVELPSRMDSGLATPFATRYVYGGASHLRGVVAFHGSMFPPVLESLRVATHNLPAPAAIQIMRTHGVSRLVVHKNLMPADSAHLITSEMNRQGFPAIFNTGSATVFSLGRR
ncbi:MAG TPA: hypothetical protein VM053_04625 [Gemmatimonadaceae bacterium]|nr:hypothetical protein [Gemmatimonadaceae bacterium]